MQENEQRLEGWTGCYTIEYLDEKSEITEKELFDTVFAKLEKIQKQAILEKIKRIEIHLTSLENELDIFLAQR